jgi:hypothetical protein
VEYFKYSVSKITNDGRGTHEFKSRIAMTKPPFNKRKTFNQQTGLKYKGESNKCYICRIVLYGAETWTLRKVDQKHLESFEMWCWRRVEKISWTDRLRNEEVLHRVKEERIILHTTKKKD